MRFLTVFLFSFFAIQPSAECMHPIVSETKIRMLYNSLDPLSVSAHFAFYELYPDTELGLKALKDACSLLTLSTNDAATLSCESLTASGLLSLIPLINKPSDTAPPALGELDPALLERLSSKLPHYRLKGHSCTTEEQLRALPPEEIDLARGLFLAQYGPDLPQIKAYEAVLDLMALQIAAQLPPAACPEEKIKNISRFIFDEMGFRFPPHSLYAKNIDRYTFLPSVLDTHRGVCLGVSILYICLAQRLSVPLEMITPPGHIYVRYKTPDTVINIETTAGGIHLDSEDYLNINTCGLQERNIKEVIGLAYFNQASVFMQSEEYEKALGCYKKAEYYLPGDNLLKELLAFTYLYTGEKEKGEALLREIKDYIPDFAITGDSVPNDYLTGKVDADTLKILHKSVEEDRASILAKKQALEEAVAKFPRFRAGVFQLAAAWMQLHRIDKALEFLKYAHNLDPGDPEGNYYLSVIYMQRLDYDRAWEHLIKAEEIVKAKNYKPKVLKELRKELSKLCPE